METLSTRPGPQSRWIPPCWPCTPRRMTGIREYFWKAQRKQHSKRHMTKGVSSLHPSNGSASAFSQGPRPLYPGSFFYSPFQSDNRKNKIPTIGLAPLFKAGGSSEGSTFWPPEAFNLIPVHGLGLGRYAPTAGLRLDGSVPRVGLFSPGNTSSTASIATTASIASIMNSAAKEPV